MKGLGSYSGFAIKMLFTAAHLKAANKETIFGEGVQRRMNFLKAAMVKINPSLAKSSLAIKPRFTYFLPVNDQETIDNLVAAIQGGIISKETAVSKNPLVDDPAEELKRIDSETNDPAVLDDLNNDDE